MTKAKKKNFIIQIYLILAIVYFVFSFKFSGSEAYHTTGVVAYIKWSILGLLVNIGYVFLSIFSSKRIQLALAPLMILAIYSNILIYQNPQKSILYFSLALLVVTCGVLLLVEKAYRHVQDLYLKR